MLDSKTSQELRDELTKTRALLNSPEWSIWVNFLKKERRHYLQNKVNTAVRAGHLVQAQIALALFDDCKRQLEIFSQHIKRTSEQAKEKPDGNNQGR